MSFIPSIYSNIRLRLARGFTNIPRRTTLTLILPLAVALIGLQLLSFTPVNKIIDQKIFHPLVFNIRHHLKPEKLDPRIKIFSFDNRTASYLKALDIPLETWALVIKELSKKSGVNIIIDKLFDSPFSDKEIKGFTEILEGTNTRTSIISFTYPGEISFRKPISKELIAKNESKTITKKDDLDYFQRLAIKNTPYGATEEVLSQFAVFGHNEYNGDNRTKPLLILENQGILLNTAVTMADRVEIAGKRLLVNDHDIHLNLDGQILINFAPNSVYQKNSYSFLAAIERAKKSADISIVKNGDFVVILPAMFTGSTDFKETPFGSMPAGYTIVAMLQSMLTDEWLLDVHDPGFIILLFGVIGFLSGYNAKPRYAVLAIAAVSMLMVAASIGLFVFWGIAFSFALPLSAALISGLAGIIVHSSVASLEETRIERELEVATLVQKSFFPISRRTQYDHVSIEGRFIPASECGGDWWGCFERNGYIYVMLGDAIGHGVPAALVTAVAFSATRTINMSIDQGDSVSVTPSKILNNINTVLCEMNSQLACMTFFILRIHQESGECIYANAGNPQPALIPQNAEDERLVTGQRIKTLMARGDVLGLSADSTFQEHTTTLKSGDRIVIYTDGLVENEIESTKKPIGKTWLKQQLNLHAQEPGDILSEKLWTAYSNQVGQLKPSDDVTIVVISRD